MKTKLIFILFLLIALIPAASAVQVYVAQGNTARVPVNGTGGSCWIFPNYGIADTRLFDVPAISQGNQTYCVLSKDYTENLDEGDYTVLYEIPAVVNGHTFKDISYINGSLISSLSSPEPYNTAGKDAATIRKKLEDIIATNHLNTYTEDQIVIQKPLLTVTSFGPTSEKHYALIKGDEESGGIVVPQIVDSPFYRITGQTNLPDGTKITVKIDELRFYAQHNSSYTYTTTVQRSDFMSSNEWSIDIALNMNDLPHGWHDISVYGGELVTTRQFKVEQQIAPTPTPTTIVHYMSDGNIEPVYINNTITVVEIQTQYVDRWHTPTPTPAITDALGDKINYPYEPGESIPVEFAYACFILIVAILVFRDFKPKGGS